MATVAQVSPRARCDRGRPPGRLPGDLLCVRTGVVAGRNLRRRGHRPGAFADAACASARLGFARRPPRRHGLGGDNPVALALSSADSGSRGPLAGPTPCHGAGAGYAIQEVVRGSVIYGVISARPVDATNVLGGTM